MRKLLVGLLLLGLLAGSAPLALAQPVPEPPTDVASYTLNARLDPAAKQVVGSGQIRFRNTSQAPTSEIWLRLYLNAFRTRDTQWLREADPSMAARFDPSNPGWIRLDRLTLSATGAALVIPSEAATDTIVRIPLPQPLAPGVAVAIDVGWTSQLPKIIARTGFSDDFFMVGQWYPKLAAFDRGRWDTEQWHANAEFFHDFGDYDLSVTTPSQFVVGATGLKTDERSNADGSRTQRFATKRVTDVAWTAWPQFQVVSRKVRVPGAEIEIELLAPESQRASFERYFSSATLALDSFGRWYGLYPWGKLTIVVPPEGATGASGMEYPMLITSTSATELPFGLSPGERELEGTTIHEIAHQWFPLQVQSNEATEPWLDEALADYLTFRVLENSYRPNRGYVDVPFFGLSYESIHRLSYAIFKTAQHPIGQRAWDLPDQSLYGATIYSKGSLALLSLQRTLGDERFTRALRAYADRWRFQHPTTADLQASLTASLGEPLGWFFDDFVRSGKTADYRVASLTLDGAQLRREGEARFPVTVAVDYANGSTALQPWPLESTSLDVQPPAGTSLTAVRIDPDRHMLLEPGRLDDARSLQPDREVALAGASRWWSFAQGLLQLLGQFG